MSEFVARYYPEDVLERARAHELTTRIGVHPQIVAALEERELAFSDFETFISTEGVSPAVRETFTRFLERLFDESSDLWYPRGCRGCQTLDKIAKKVAEEFDTLEIEGRNWGSGAHLWLVAIIDGCQQELVIDPFGVTTPTIDYDEFRGSVLPSFGILDQASNNAPVIYSKGERVVAGVYRIFMP